MNNYFIWLISLLAIAGVIIRPFKLPEAVWAIGGALLLLGFGFISFETAAAGVEKGTDVYLFLAGMMLLSEAAREEKLFDWIAGHAVKASRGSAHHLFLLIFLSGIIVTALLSNDATAVVLTPAVIAATRAAGVKNNLPYLLICAFIANAASFVLPISNPANLVIYQTQLPSLGNWFAQFLLPAAIVIVLTYFILKISQRKALSEKFSTDIPVVTLSTTGKLALYSIIFTVFVLLICSAYSVPLGWPTFITGFLCTAIISLIAKKSILKAFGHVSWSVLILVAGLFIIVEGLTQTGITHHLATMLANAAKQNVNNTAIATGGIIGIACNLMNNLPAGLIVGEIAQTAVIPDVVRKAMLIGIDLGPNLSVTGSLATILWLQALRREGITVSAVQFLKIGLAVMLIPMLVVLLLLPYI
ncbi:arsenic transporter [Mucilaginibacter roseus]|uniref:Arsenic transporter n=1 Tax=Mucilaginibacter roseus TaxID=1528868 RepID=A0ABS8U623_9SPHI|nr:arsenic transporter [Mucilaginibacter roseus]MCD8741016.1 arsenic transporter [Mucilaginibacter roseus]